MANWSSKIFRAYDIRGIYPSELNEEAAEAIGRVLVKLSNAGRVVVGRDMRLSSEKLQQALISGLQSAGVAVNDLGLVPIDAVYFAVGKFNYDAGIMITASHNPPEYNGFKVVGPGGRWIRGQELKELIEREQPIASQQGNVESFDIWPSYLGHLRSFVKVKDLKPLKVMVDAGNGLAGQVIPKLFEHLPFKLTPLFFELDGRAPNRPFNPLAPGASEAAAVKVREVKADVGVMFDGDTDRVFFLDEQGKFVPADVTLLLLAREFLRREPGAAIAYNLICSRAVPEFIRRWGGKPLRSAVGYVNVSKALRENNGLMSGELSAHYSFRDNYYTDSGFIALLVVLELLSKEQRPLSQLVKNYSPYFKLPEINLRVDNQQELIERVKRQWPEGQIDELDGVTVQFPDWWVNARPSNTEPLLRVTIEANSAELLEQKKAEILSLLQP